MIHDSLDPKHILEIFVEHLLSIKRRILQKMPEILFQIIQMKLMNFNKVNSVLPKVYIQKKKSSYLFRHNEGVKMCY